MVAVLCFTQSPPAVGVSLGTDFVEHLRVAIPEAIHPGAQPGSTAYVLARSSWRQ